MKKLNKYIIVIAIFFLIFIIIFLSNSRKHHKMINSSKSDFYPYVYYLNLNENTQINNFQNRECVIDKKENKITVGKNSKQIENGYYDLQFIFSNNYFDIYINKLTKEDKITQNISEQYVEELNQFMAMVINKQSNQIKENIVSEFLNLRNDINKVSEDKKIKNEIIDSYNVEYMIENNKLKIRISLRGDV